LAQDEVARNGAFEKKLRPEVFPNAPCNTPFVAEARSARFPAFPLESSWKMRISRETGGVPANPFSFDFC